jgi:uncharacterized protein YbcC (UPF0753/DUF2309 family)
MIQTEHNEKIDINQSNDFKSMQADEPNGIIASKKNESITLAVKKACARIAPTWPLDQFIAVNPFWGFIDQPFEQLAVTIENLCGTQLIMPLDWYLSQYESGQISQKALQHSLTQHGFQIDSASFIKQSEQQKKSFKPLPLATHLLDDRRNLNRHASCHSIVINTIGQHCAAWFDQGQSRWQPNKSGSLYSSWKHTAALDNGPALLTGIAGIAARIAKLPQDPHELIKAACEALKIDPSEYEQYFTALLLDINGWSAWCAYLNWQAQQHGQTDQQIEQLFAIRLAWEWVLTDCFADPTFLDDWATQRLASRPIENKNMMWVWQDALEKTWQQKVNQGIALSLSKPSKLEKRPALQAVFCIDVRSEVIRRALEASNPAIQTHGFAGFFGLPIDYMPFAGKQARPQLPGLLAPQVRVESQAGTLIRTEQLAATRQFRLGVSQAWQNFRTTANSVFGFVETTGLSYAWKLLQASLHNSHTAGTDTECLTAIEQAQLQPVLTGVTLDESIAMAGNIIKAMSLKEFAPIVLLVGHGSQSANNPHAAGLDCGACCGQTGEINARVLAKLLNHEDVRKGLTDQGFNVPTDTLFIAGLHNTTTDHIKLFDTQHIDIQHQKDLTMVYEWLQAASQRIRFERAPSLDLQHITDPHLLEQSLQDRAHDWSQVRPEWALANNAAFIAAPRHRSQQMNLKGRSFLHDYNHLADTNNSILELILTAPVVVAHWINMQYFASTVDNTRWGSGNKVLHNVVGGNIGVFEGNGGDLRIGLPMQSIHNGENWVHSPLRLSVWVEAPAEDISKIIEKHAMLGQLFNGQWLHLFCIEPDTHNILRWQANASKNNQNDLNNSKWIVETL